MKSQDQVRSVFIYLIACIFPILLNACNRPLWGDTNTGKSQNSDPGVIYSSPPDQVNPNESYVFYIHGAIMETEGADAVSPEFGLYEFSEILEYFAGSGYNVIGEIRGPTPDTEQYADHIIESVKSLQSQGVPSTQIALMGFSKGAGITLDASSRLDDPNVKYVLIGICGDWLDRDLVLTGKVLSLYEESDPYGSSCQELADRSPELVEFKEIVFTTGKSHGTFYTADPLWMDPVIDWLDNQDR